MSTMSNKITGKEYLLSKIFSADFEYHIKDIVNAQ